MRAVAKKIQMIRLQENHNKREENTKTNCIEQCTIERECIQLKTNTAKKRSPKKQTSEEQWDDKCKQAVQLFNQGMEYPNIAKKIGCNVSSLYRELKKRDLLQMPKQVAPPKSVKPPIILPRTKKSRFERYKEYYMYR